MAALLHGSGPDAPYLELARAGESLADTEAIVRLAARAGVDVQAAGQVQIEALVWAEGVAG